MYITEEEFASLSQKHEENLYTMAPEEQSFEEQREVSDSLSSTVQEKQDPSGMSKAALDTIQYFK